MNGKFTTYSGLEFSPEIIKTENITIKDIAHALSMICRFNGHIKNFYSVAQHCMQVSDHLRELGFNNKIQLCGLLHDAAEAYLGDIPTPIKKTLSDYSLLDKQYQRTIFKCFGLLNTWEQVYLTIKEIDEEILKEEWELYSGDYEENNFDGFYKVEEDYLNLYNSLCNQGD